MKYLIRNKMARSWPGGTNRKLSALFFPQPSAGSYDLLRPRPKTFKSEACLSLLRQ